MLLVILYHSFLFLFVSLSLVNLTFQIGDWCVYAGGLLYLFFLGFFMLFVLLKILWLLHLWLQIISFALCRRQGAKEMPQRLRAMRLLFPEGWVWFPETMWWLRKICNSSSRGSLLSLRSLGMHMVHVCTCR